MRTRRQPAQVGKGTSWKIFNGLVRFALTATWYRQSELRNCITISLEPDVAAEVCLRQGSRDANHFANVDFHELWDAGRCFEVPSSLEQVNRGSNQRSGNSCASVASDLHKCSHYRARFGKSSQRDVPIAAHQDFKRNPSNAQLKLRRHLPPAIETNSFALDRACPVTSPSSV
jgi:hypothetical protein